MTEGDEELIPVFMPALSALLLRAEDLKESPLTHEQVTTIRDQAVCIMMKPADAQALADSRGYNDVDPENCWYDWQQLRRELGRKPDLDPGPKFNQIRSSDPEYQQTIRDAHSSLFQFRSLLPADGSPRRDAMVKTRVGKGDSAAFMWLCNARQQGSGFVAEFFEVPETLSEHSVGDELEVPETELLDWMVNEDGVLSGGFSIRYYRAKLPEDERAGYDEYIGVTTYA